MNMKVMIKCDEVMHFVFYFIFIFIFVILFVLS